MTKENSGLSNVRSNDLLCCPFCGEKDFDLIGLKDHIRMDRCDAYRNTPNALELRFRGRKNVNNNETTPI